MDASRTTGAHRSGATEKLPVQVHFLMNDKCNARCIMCGGDYFHADGRRRITIEKFRKMAENLRLERFGGVVLAGWGDPLLNPDLLPILDHLMERYPSVRVSVTTNGIALSQRMARNLIDRRVFHVNVSLNAATPETYRRVMQVDRFAQVVTNIAGLSAARRECGQGPVLRLSMAINRHNIEELPLMIALAGRLKLDSVNVMYTRFYPERIRSRNVDRPEDRLRDEDSLYFHQALSDAKVSEAAGFGTALGVAFSHEPLFRDNAPGRTCVWPEQEIMVGFDGEIYPCGGAEVHFREKVEKGIYHFGNALTESIDDFWNGPAYRELRASSRSGCAARVVECRCCANIMKPGDRDSHIMRWEGEGSDGETDEARKEGAKIAVGRPEGPLVSVIVPTHDRPEMVTAAIRSILDQTYRNLEIVVVNDAGRGVEEVVAGLNRDGRITYVRHDRNRGLGAARNTGIRLARGKYITYLDDDDLYYPDHIDTLVTHLEKVGCKVAYTDAHRAHQKMTDVGYVTINRDIPYSRDFDRDLFLINNYVPVLCFMHEKACLEESGYFDETLTSSEDWDLWIRMSRKYDFAHIKKVTCQFSWRTDGTTMSSGNRPDLFRTMEIIYGKYRHIAQGNPLVLKAQKRNLDIMRPKAVETDDNSASRLVVGEKGRVVAASDEPRSAFACSIVIPVFNQLEFTRQCVKAIAANTLRGTASAGFELIVVDNASTDGTEEFLASLGGDVVTLRNTKNLGFAKACNQGARVSRGRNIVFLNNDTVPQPGWLEALLAATKEEDAAICGARLLYPDGRIQHAGVAFNSNGIGYHIFNGFPKDHPAVTKRRRFRAVTAACMLVRRDVFEVLGGFDEGYRNGFEDVDFCLRAGEKGYRVLYAPESVVVHHEETSEGRKAHDRENLVRFLARWRGKVDPDDDRILAEEGFRKIVSSDGTRFTIEPVTGQTGISSAGGRSPGSAGRRGDPLQENRPGAKDHASRGLALKKEKRYLEAIEAFRQARSGGDLSVQAEIGDCLAQEGKLEEAGLAYQEAVMENPRDPRAQAGLGVLDLVHGNHDRAAERFTSVLETDDRDATALCGMGLARKAGGGAGEAFGWFCRALDADPVNVTALHELVKAAHELGRLEEAERYLLAYLQYKPSDPHILFSLAGVLYKAGKFEEALDTIERLRLFSPMYDGAAELEERIITEGSGVLSST